MFGAANTLFDLIHIQLQIRQKKLVQKHPEKSSKTLALLPSRFEREGEELPPFPKWEPSREAFSYPPVFGSGRRSKPAQGREPRGEGRRGAGSPTPQPTSQKPVFSSFQTLLIIFFDHMFSIVSNLSKLLIESNKIS